MKAMSILGNIKAKLGSNWDDFIEALTKKANQIDKHTDGTSIHFSYFEKLLKSASYDYRMSASEKDILVRTFGAKSESEG